jgi:ABC-2 type transport system ATP-binding protein
VTVPAEMAPATALARTESALIDASHLSRHFGHVVAVADVSLSVAPGEVVALLGPNGAGKTTTLQMLAGLLPPSGGEARVAGYDVIAQAAQVRARVGLMVDEPGFYPEMTIVEYLTFMARLYGMSAAGARQHVDAMVARFDLVAKRDARLSSLSKGMRQKVALSRALIHLPPVLLLDEPTSALDPLSSRAVHHYIRERRTAGDAIILSTHQLAEAESLADRVVIIAAGRIQRQGTWEELRRPVIGQESFQLTLAHAPPVDVLSLARAVPGMENARMCEDTAGRPIVAYQTRTPDRTNPALTATLCRHGLAVLLLEPRVRSMQTVYLEALGEADGVADRDHLSA